MEHNELKGKKGFKRILNAAGYSADGLQAAFRYEAAFRQLLLLHAVLLIIVCCADFDLPVRMVLVFASFFSLDDISLELRPLAKRAKDIGSAAQMMALTLVFILWLMALCGG